jgi:ABC-2 type transport system permease protein
MKSLYAAVMAEYKKAVKSAVMPVTFIVAAFVPLMMAFMMFVLKNPELSHKLGLLGAKAKLAGSADWPSYLTFLTQGVCGIEIVIFGFVCSWAFGREYADRTIKDMIALPISRASIVAAKLIVTAVWCASIYIFIFAVSIAAGSIVSLPLWDGKTAVSLFWTLLISSIAIIYLNSVVAFIASAARGYLAAVGFVIFSAVLINFTGILGFGDYYPWAIPVYFAMKTGGVQPGLISWIIVLITGAAGIAATIGWWRYADQA